MTSVSSKHIPSTTAASFTPHWDRGCGGCLPKQYPQLKRAHTPPGHTARLRPPDFWDFNKDACRLFKATTLLKIGFAIFSRLGLELLQIRQAGGRRVPRSSPERVTCHLAEIPNVPQEDLVKERKEFIPLHPSGVHGGAHGGKARLRWHGAVPTSSSRNTPSGHTARRGRFTPPGHRSARTPSGHTAGTVCALVN